MAHLGMRIVEVAPERVVGELEIGEHLKTTTGAVHGGTLMAFADTIGAVGTSAMGLKTATLESKTNFFAAATAGKLRAESTALHKGRRTHVWQTRITLSAAASITRTRGPKQSGARRTSGANACRSSCSTSKRWSPGPFPTSICPSSR